MIDDKPTFVSFELDEFTKIMADIKWHTDHISTPLGSDMQTTYEITSFSLIVLVDGLPLSVDHKYIHDHSPLLFLHLMAEIQKRANN
jgi:hypothetical protein